MPPAARVSDMHTCPMCDGPIPHVGGPILPPGVPTVLIGFQPAATVTCSATCVGPFDMIARGSSGVFINYLPAARLGDQTTHGGVIVSGDPTVLIGEVGAAAEGVSGAIGVLGGLAVSGATELQQNPSRYSEAHPQSSQPSAEPAAASSPLVRLQIARAFFDQTGWSLERKESHLRGIDLTQPVEVVTLPAGTLLQQWMDPHQSPGSYYSAGLRAEDRPMMCPDKEHPCQLRAFCLNRETRLLRSIAASLKIDWLGDQLPMELEGGSMQYFALPTDRLNFGRLDPEPASGPEEPLP